MYTFSIASGIVVARKMTRLRQCGALKRHLMDKNFAKKSAPLLFLPAIVCSYGVLAFQPELRLVVALLVGVTAFLAVVSALTLYLGELGNVSWSPSVILCVALLLRLLFLLSPPQLSDDVYRYLWDGSQLLRGNNPYAAAPAAVQPPPERAEIHSRINHPDHVTLYPPRPRSSLRRERNSAAASLGSRPSWCCLTWDCASC